jgi:hypothetical protein
MDKAKKQKTNFATKRLRPVYARDLVITGGYVGQGTQRARRLDSKREPLAFIFVSFVSLW